MKGNKAKYFLLNLSFIGWCLLAAIPAGIIQAIGSTTFDILRTEIYECSQGAGQFSRCDGIRFLDCNIHDGPSPALSFTECGDKTWNNKAFTGLNGVYNVDENGEPLVVYHGTKEKPFEEFDKDMIGARYLADERGFFFTSSPKIAERYARSEFSDRYGGVITVFINERNPLIADSKWARKNGMTRAFKELHLFYLTENPKSGYIDTFSKVSKNRDLFTRN